MKPKTLAMSVTMCVALLAGSVISAWSATLDFRFQGGAVTQTGSLTGVSGTQSTGGSAVGDDIIINELFVSGAGVAANGTYTVVDGLLNFDTTSNILNLVGKIPSLSINSTIALISSGSFNSFTGSFGGISSFVGTGPDTKHVDLLAALSLSTTPFKFMTVELAGTALDPTAPTTAGLINQSTPIPTPTSFILFGTGLVGLITIVRRDMLANLLNRK